MIRILCIPVALAYVLGNKGNSIPTVLFVFWAGVGNTVAAVVCPIVGMRMELLGWTGRSNGEYIAEVVPERILESRIEDLNLLAIFEGERNESNLILGIRII